MQEPLDRDQWRRVSEMLDAVLELPPDARESYLEAACRDDDDLRRRVEDLVRAAAAPDTFLDAPAFERAAPPIAEFTAVSGAPPPGRGGGGGRRRAVPSDAGARIGRHGGGLARRAGRRPVPAAGGDQVREAGAARPRGAAPLPAGTADSGAAAAPGDRESARRRRD